MGESNLLHSISADSASCEHTGVLIVFYFGLGRDGGMHPTTWVYIVSMRSPLLSKCITIPWK